MELHDIESNLQRLSEEKIFILDILSDSSKLDYNSIVKYRELLSKINIEISSLKKMLKSIQMKTLSRDFQTDNLLHLEHKFKEEIFNKTNLQNESNLAEIFNQIGNKSHGKVKNSKKI